MSIEGISGNLTFLIPLFFLCYAVSLFFIGSSPLASIPLFVYLVLAIVDSLYLSFRYKKNLMTLPVIYLIMHLSYACGLLSGICRNIFSKQISLMPKTNHEIIYIKEITP